VLVPRRLLDGEAPREDGRGELLRRGLADGARDGREPEPGILLQPAGEREKGLLRIAGQEDREIRRQPLGPPRRQDRPRSRHARPRPPPGPRARDLGAVPALPSHGDEEVPRPGAPRIERAPGKERLRSRRSDRRAGPRRGLRHGEVHLRASSAATSRSSKGSTLSPMTCVVSCPFPAITTTTPGLARPIAARMPSPPPPLFPYLLPPA